MPPDQAILLVGGAGFLGLALARRLVADGRTVHVLSRSSDDARHDGITFHRGSQDDHVVVAPLLRECPIVVHLASTTTPGSSARRPQIDTLENLLPAARLTEMMANHPPARLLFASSGGAIYGNPTRLPVDETHPPQPLSYHAAGKVALESLFEVFAQANRVPLATLRLSNLYGPGQRLRGGFGLVRTLLERVRRGEPVEMWGDGGAIRDYLYIDDAVDACRRLIGDPEATGTFNVGSGLGASISELIDLVGRVTGRVLQVRQRPARGTDVRAIVLDSTRLQRATGWRPLTDLPQGIQQTWRWLDRDDA